MADGKPTSKRPLEDDEDSLIPSPKREKTSTEEHKETEAVPANNAHTPENTSQNLLRAPSAISDSTSETSEASEEISELQKRRPKTPITVLVVDDSATVRKITKAKLEDAGYRVEIAINGEEALGKYASHPRGHYNIILLDIYMPVLDGVRLANIIRERETLEGKGDHQIIIGLSAETRDITADIMDSCLLKPFDLESFESCVRLYNIH